MAAPMQAQLPADLLMSQLTPQPKRMSGGMIAIIVLLSVLILIGGACLWRMPATACNKPSKGLIPTESPSPPEDDPNFTPL